MGSAAGIDAGSGSIEDMRTQEGFEYAQERSSDVIPAPPQEGSGPLIDTMGLLEDVENAPGE